MGDAPQAGSPKADTRRGGAPRGNTNAQRHGLRSAKLPRDRRHIEHSLAQLRRSLESETQRRYGGISPMQAALISTAIRQETTAQLAEAWLRTEPKLSLAERLTIRDRVGSATEARDRAIERLQLEGSVRGGARNRFADLYGNGWGAPAAQNGHGDDLPGSDGSDEIPADTDAAESERGGVA